ncbi:aminophospholipid translocase [Brettanomyces nanus]|uniref:Phospholipid-transporting ATPase n=1 Tax=Eeniella nana TaxID=13502 RepID=A0A875RXD6_EENNA|nr:aminophospholipid translocase [Brettanomyces nanus]QPG76827.1 aminophospholipid translocase [Brettanomyces nanus]
MTLHSSRLATKMSYDRGNHHFVIDDDENLLDIDEEPAHQPNDSSTADIRLADLDPFADNTATNQTNNSNNAVYSSTYDPFMGSTVGIDETNGINTASMNPFDDSHNTSSARTAPPTSTGFKGAFDQLRNTLGFKYENVGNSDANFEIGDDNSGDIGDDNDDDDDYNDQYDTVLHDRRGEDNTNDSSQGTNQTFAQFDIRRWFRKSPNDDSSKPRLIYINSPHENKAQRYCDNHISTTKYNAFTFLPKFFFEQFSKYANLFFLFTSIIQQVPNVSPTNRYTTIGTLGVVLLVSAIKEISEDLKRQASDSELNRSAVEILDVELGEYVRRKWIDVKIGDIIKISNEESIPADLILLSSSEPDGLCYIETANLDGETNLKIKQACEQTSHLLSPADMARCRGRIVSEKPNSSLYTYEGTLFVNDREVSLSPDQLLLRGANLRNTIWVQGIVVFTGHETKLMRNATAAPIKRTDMERIINMQIVALFALLVVLSIVSSLGDVINLAVNGSSLSYLNMQSVNKVGLFFLDFLTYWILYSNLVPISMFVTVEIIKYYQAYLISSDLDMYYEPTDTPTVARTSSLVDELGQIQYVFSDKTGTLTRNVMVFRACSIGGRCYIEKIPEDRQATMVDGIEMGYHTFSELQTDRLKSGHHEVINQFLLLLASCHTVIPEVKDDGTIKYQASSLDEGALVEGAAMLGYKFHIRKPSTIAIDVDGEDLSFELLNICEFNSTRKRMSTIFRCPDGKIRLYVKGADTVIFQRLSPDQEFLDATTHHLEDFAAEGLRTLCLAERVLSDNEYQTWNKVYQEASVSLEDRSKKLDSAAELVEKDLYLLGATAIEDKLQDGVPETISVLQEAGIKVWVLTGDRQETAINVGMSCKLLSEDMNLLIVNEDSKESTRENIGDKLNALHSNELSQDDISSLALVIDGKSLGFALQPDLEDQFLELGVLCKAVLCCRVSPLQKALVVKLVKRKKKALLLAIGDGANDVSMIQAAHVGVGISGLEGMQAARSADFSIGQFKYLKKLLLVHGSWSYQRLSLSILYSFYKNITLYMCQFWFVFSSAYSGQSIVESWTLTMYNVIFLALPPFVIGIFDQYISANMLLQYPQMFKLGQDGHFFNVEIFWAWAANGFFHSAIIYICVINIYKYGSELAGGQVADIWVVGVSLYTVCLLTSLGKAALVSSQWTKFTLIAIPGSFLMWLIAFPLYALIAPRVDVSKEYWGITRYVYGSLLYWMTIIVVPALCLLRDFLWKFYKRNWNPEFYHEVQKIQKYQIQDHKPKFSSFQKTIRKVRQVHRMRKQRGFAFSQAEGQEAIVRKYDTTKRRGAYGELE